MGMAQSDRTYDAIVIGSGISGGWAAKELCDHGLKTLVLERGRDVQHIKDYPTANMAPWELPHRGYHPRKLIDANPLISKAAGYGEATAHFFVKDADHPYAQERPFDWIRGARPACLGLGKGDDGSLDVDDKEVAPVLGRRVWSAAEGATRRLPLKRQCYARLRAGAEPRVYSRTSGG
jgi:putative NAD(P)-binding protein